MEGDFPPPGVPAPPPKSVDPPPTSTGGGKSQPLAEQVRAGGRRSWRTKTNFCKQLFGANAISIPAEDGQRGRGGTPVVFLTQGRVEFITKLKPLRKLYN